MNILIAGDSWGCGEWDCFDNGTHSATHKGIEQYFIDNGNNVTNVAKGACSNKYSCLQLVNELLNTSYDYTIWFQTDPLRDLRPYTTFVDDYHTYDELLDQQHSLLVNTYGILNGANTKILCIGGCSKLDMTLISRFDNLIPIIPSVIEFLVPQYSHPKIWQSDWQDLGGRQFDITSLDKLVSDLNKQWSIADTPKFFIPDGMHANRHGHKLIFDYLYNYMVPAN